MKIASSLRASFSTSAIALACIAPLCAPALLTAQQAYPASPYSAAPGNPYAQPQYQQPQYGYAQPSPQESYAAPNPDQQLWQPAVPSQSLSAEQLEQLLAPIALYPDALLAQILTASTYPAQVAVADQWLQQMRAQGYGSPDQVAAGADAQGDWDPSVKALTAFPDVLDLLNHDLDWTTALGDAYYNQPQDVMQTVQVLRDRAQQAGNLQTTPQEDVTDNQGYIDIAPPNPEVVYVPTYDPWDVYGAPIVPYPGFSLVGALGSFFGGPPIEYGLCFALGAFERTPFGMMAWGLDWLGHAVLFHHSGYFTASASVRDWGLPRGGPRAYNGAFRGWRQNARAPGGYNNFNRSYGAPQNSYQNSNQRSYQNSYHDAYQGGGAYGNRALAQNYARQPEATRETARSNAYPDAYSYRGAQQQTYGSPRPALPAQNYERSAPQNYAYRPQTYPNRPQTYSNPGYGYANHSQQPSYSARPGYSYSQSYPSYRAPQTDPRAYSGRSYQMARNESGGFRGFTSGKQPNYSAPKFSAPRSYGGGGHFSAPKAPSMSHSSGGGGRRR